MTRESGEYSSSNENKPYPTKWVNKNIILNENRYSRLCYETILLRLKNKQKYKVQGRLGGSVG